MSSRRLAAVLAAAVAAEAACRRESVASAEPVEVAAAIDHADWSRLLRTYVDERGLVDYAGWKAATADREALRRYLTRLAAPASPAAQGENRAASFINAYNALTISWILDNYPAESIRALKDSFDAARHTVGGRRVSLDDIEHRALRPQVGYRVHAVLVCAARSCPPLGREAYTADRLQVQLDAAMARWLSREDLNRFDLAAGRAGLSSIFKWFAEDFEKAGGTRAVLRRHGPPAARQAAENTKLKIEYLDYDWSLNDQRPSRGSYGRLRLIWDEIKSRLP